MEEIIHKSFVIQNNKEDAEKMLRELCEFDAEFCENEDYNIEYCLSYAKQQKYTTKDMIEQFIDMWMESNELYYTSYSLKIIESNDKLSISFVFTINDN